MLSHYFTALRAHLSQLVKLGNELLESREYKGSKLTLTSYGTSTLNVAFGYNRIIALEFDHSNNVIFWNQKNLMCQYNHYPLRNLEQMLVEEVGREIFNELFLTA